MDKKPNKPVSAITADDIPAINAILAKEDSVWIQPYKNGDTKILHKNPR